MMFELRTWLRNTVKVTPALVQLLGVSDLFTHVEPIETSTTKLFFVQTLTEMHQPVFENENTSFGDLIFTPKGPESV